MNTVVYVFLDLSVLSGLSSIRPKYGIYFIAYYKKVTLHQPGLNRPVDSLESRYILLQAEKFSRRLSCVE